MTDQRIRRMGRRVVAAAFAAGAIGVAGCGTASQQAQPASQQQTFYNMQILSGSVRQASDSKLAKAGSSDRVSSVSCFMTGPSAAVCDVTGTSGSEANLSIAIDRSGNEWASTGAQ